MKNKFSIAIVAVFLTVLGYFLFNQIVPIRPDVNSFSFNCFADSDCVLVSIECCNNNAPTQNSCMNSNYVLDWNGKLEKFCMKAALACPEYYMEGSYSCLCQQNRCWTNFTSPNEVVMYSGVPKGK